MCVGVPMRIAAIDGIAARAEDGDREALIDLSLTPAARVGDWVLTHLGTAREVIAPGEAQKIRAALRALDAVMAGGTPGDAFADIEARGPTLPPHLQAALDAGRAEG
ncbi:MAG TPA: hydrogenase [Rhodobacteraceae bacterium]|jgi:hydrogenase expression/formation protein HypC|nr:HypC/HybG/HupF family hydrogenase formation chaperone [Paracoccaceae bacterium]HBG99621.1 hydrogenase [Paracoccaceae bacterium]